MHHEESILKLIRSIENRLKRIEQAIKQIDKAYYVLSEAAEASRKDINYWSKKSLSEMDNKCEDRLTQFQMHTQAFYRKFATRDKKQ